MQHFEAFMNVIHAHLPTAVVALACALAPLLQIVKRYVPAVKGWRAVVLNLVCGIVAVFAVTPAAQFWTVDAWMRVVELSGLAAGIYGTAKSLGHTPSVDTPMDAGGTGYNKEFSRSNPLNTSSHDPQLTRNLPPKA